MYVYWRAPRPSHQCYPYIYIYIWPVYLWGLFIVLCSWPRPMRIISNTEQRTCTSRLSGTRRPTRTHPRQPHRPARSRTSSRVSWAASRKELRTRWTTWTRNARRRMPAPKSWWTASSIRSRPRSTKPAPRRTSPDIRNHRRKNTSRTPPTRPRTQPTRPRMLSSTRPRTSWNPKSPIDDPFDTSALIIYYTYRKIITHFSCIQQWASINILDNVLSNVAAMNACYNIFRHLLTVKTLECMWLHWSSCKHVTSVLWWAVFHFNLYKIIIPLQYILNVLSVSTISISRQY